MSWGLLIEENSKLRSRANSALYVPQRADQQPALSSLLPGAEPFLYEAGCPPSGAGCVLVHGFTSTPGEMRGLGGYLAEQGITAYAPLLPGHGTSPADLQGKTWRDWHVAVDQALDEMRTRCTRVYVAGLSLGGALALYTASQRGDEVAGVVSMSAPIFLPRGLCFVLRTMKPRVPYMRKQYRDIQDPVTKARHLNYKRVPVGAIASLIEFLGPVRASLPDVKVPALIMYARRDHVVPPVSSRYIYRRIGSTDKRLVVLRKGFHIMTVDNDRERVYSCIRDFIRGREM